MDPSRSGQGTAPREIDGCPLRRAGAAHADRTAFDVVRAGPCHPIDDLRQAHAGAKAGDILELTPGTYPVTRSLQTAADGTPRRHIVVRARQAGTRLFEASAIEGFVVRHPYWVFENLNWRGVCADHSRCEHAYHVVGAARGTTLRNNRLEDFNAHVKVNGEGGQWPDAGLLQFSTLTNRAPRQTENPTTPFNLMAAHDWQVPDNLVENFVRTNVHPTYGVFMKGASQRGSIARNLVICSRSTTPLPGQRVGNLTDSHLRQLDDTVLQAEDKLTPEHLDTLLAAPDRLDLRWQDRPTQVRTRPAVPTDFCGQPRGLSSPVGATGSPPCT